MGGLRRSAVPESRLSALQQLELAGLAFPVLRIGEPVLALAHGQDRVTIRLSEHSLRALGLAILTSVGADGC